MSGRGLILSILAQYRSNHLLHDGVDCETGIGSLGISGSAAPRLGGS